MRQRIAPPGRLAGSVCPPGDKSVSHRSLILNALAHGTATVSNLSPGGDCSSTMSCLRAMGVQIERDRSRPGTVTVTGRDGLLAEPSEVLDAGNSGTTMRLLSGVLAGQPLFSVITGDPSLRSRPMGRVAEPLRLMGARVDGRHGGTLAPLAIRGGGLQGIEYRLPVASAQLKSCLLLAGLSARGTTRLVEPAPSRDHTERMLAAMGAGISVQDGAISIVPGLLRARDIQVPADISSAAFWLVAGAAHRDARVRVRAVGVNPSRTGVLDALRRMGARLAVEGERLVGGEPVADIVVESSGLRGIEVGGQEVPALIDEIPVLAVAACMARGTTVFRDAGELRAKESDRIASMCRELSRMGARVEELPDGMVVHGPAALRGATCRSYGDHRVAMALAVAATLARGDTVVQGAECASISYPGFWDDLRSLSSGEADAA